MVFEKPALKPSGHIEETCARFQFQELKPALKNDTLNFLKPLGFRQNRSIFYFSRSLQHSALR
jgi:hypothetical protein